jgi:hypothetical protein
MPLHRLGFEYSPSKILAEKENINIQKYLYIWRQSKIIVDKEIIFKYYARFFQFLC